MELLFVACIFAATFVLALGILALAVPAPGQRRLARLGRSEARPRSAGRESLIHQDDEGALVRTLRRLGDRSGSGAASETLRARLIHAGYRGRNAAAVYTGIRIVSGLGLPAIATLVPATYSLSQTYLTVLLCSAVTIGYVGPSWWLDRAKKRRQQGLERSLPDALDLMVVCVEAGLGINASLARVAQEFALSNPVISSEFNLVVHETQAGRTTTDALRNLAHRTGVGDISSLVALLVQTERFGTSVADALRVHADAMRVRRMNRAEERAQQAPLKMIGPSSMIFAGLLVVFLLPAAVHFGEAFAN